MADTGEVRERHQQELDALIEKQRAELEEEPAGEPVEAPEEEPIEEPTPEPEEKKEYPAHSEKSSQTAFKEYLKDKTPQDKPVPAGKPIADLEAELEQARTDLADMVRESPESSVLGVYEDNVKRLEKQIHAARGTFRTGTRGAFADYLDSKDKK